ncbi:MAG: glycosyltransferase [Planctomycetes bacterium]|nr:glycosyltransferase [Planctomycetota bacterium]
MTSPPPDSSAALNILMVNTRQNGGGAGRVGEALADQLRRDGNTVAAFVAGNPRHEPDCHQTGHWLERRAGQWLGKHGWPELGHPSSLLWNCRAEYAAADVLHWHNLHGEYLSLAALPLWGWEKPIVWTWHDFWPLTGNCATPRSCQRWQQACGRCPLRGVYPMSPVDRSRFYRWLKPRLIRAAQPLLVTPSHWLARQVRTLPAFAHLHLRVIPNPIDCDCFKPVAARGALRQQFGLRPDGPLIVMTGANWSDTLKGGRDALVALRSAARTLGGLQLLIIGRNSEKLLTESGLHGKALPFVELRESLAQAYAAADVCLFPSLAENYPLTTLEAMACGTPIVAYNVGGVPEQIAHRETGFLARAAHPAELAAGLVFVAGDVERARRMGAAARRRVAETHRVSTVAAAYRQTYVEALHAWQRRTGRSPVRTPGQIARWLCHAIGWQRPPTVCSTPIGRAAEQPAWGGVS